MLYDHIHEKPARAFSSDEDERALAQYAVTGTIRGVFYAGGACEDALAALARRVSPDLVARTAIWSRQYLRTWEIPAFLVAHLAVRDVALMERVFARVIDDGRMLRSFVRVVRSGCTGRKSFGSAPKRAMRRWFASRTPEVIFRQSSGHGPSMSDVIKMVRPPPRNEVGEADAVREALYGYLVGKNVDDALLPPLTRAFEAWKRDGGAVPPPHVPFEMLAALPLHKEHWTALLTTMTLGELRRSLVTLLCQGVLAEPAAVETVVSTLAGARELAPYELLATHRAMSEATPRAIRDAISLALDRAVSGAPAVGGDVVICPDVSGSMQATLDTNVRCLDVSALVAAAIGRKNPRARIVPFADDAPLRGIEANGWAPDLVVVVSDSQSWSGAPAAASWARIRAKSPRAKLVLVDLRPAPRAPRAPRPASESVLDVRGFSDAVLDVIAAFARGDLEGDGWLRAIQAVEVDTN